MSGIRQARYRLQSGQSRLQDQWQATSGRWHDLVRQRFERAFLQEYERVLPSALKETDRLADVIDQARREVK